MLKLYPKLAWQNIRKNYRVTVPYLLSGAGMVMLYYIIYSLAVGCAQSEFYGARSSAMVLELGVYVVTILAAIFLFYTNSFVMKRRKKELGLYNILGMEKRHIAGIILTETLMTALISLGFGLGLGMAFAKVFFLVMGMLIGGTIPIPFVIPPIVILHAAMHFGGIFLLSGCYNILQVRLSKPIELLHGGEVGEKEPKAHWLLAILGLGLLGSGYYLAVSIQDPLQALLMFFVAVILVILGTYLLFMVGITAFLKLLKKSKSFYYKTRHFTAVSGMLYRMKQNAAGLASICILFTCLLVTVSTTFALYTGMDDMITQTSPRDLNFSLQGATSEEMDSFREASRQIAAAHGAEMENLVDRQMWVFAGARTGNEIHINDGLASDTYSALEIFRLEDYNQYAGEARALAADEVLLYDPFNTYDFDTMRVFGREYKVTEVEFPFGKTLNTSMLSGYETYCLVLNDPAVIDGESIPNTFEAYDEERYHRDFFDIERYYSFDLKGHDRDAIVSVYEDLYDWLVESIRTWRFRATEDNVGLSYSYSNVVERREEFTSLYGGVFFLGLFMGVVFLLGTMLIIYYKQVSEGYEDAKRFKIMQDVGMSHQEVKKSIHSQVLMVFFLPLFTAVVHLCFAFPMLQKILGLMNMLNFHLILTSMAGCVLVFSLCYLLIYLRTARTYYKIVESTAGTTPKQARGTHYN